ncbi:MAG: hypothetical protein AB7I35_12155 [Ramlibacter sp.]
MIKTIPLKDVSNALMCARVKQFAKRSPDDKPLARLAAFTQYPGLCTGCRERLRWQRRPPLAATFGLMSRGDLARLLERVRRERGRAEVVRTWGAGVRAMRQELADGVLR